MQLHLPAKSVKSLNLEKKSIRRTKKCQLQNALSQLVIERP